MREKSSRNVCDCGMPQRVVTAVTDAGYPTLDRAIRMCRPQFGLCAVRRAFLKSLFDEAATP